MEKLLSKRGQLSMEVGILVAAAVAVAAVAAYYYVTSVRNSAQNVGGTASNTINRLKDTATGFTNSIPTRPGS